VSRGKSKRLVELKRLQPQQLAGGRKSRNGIESRIERRSMVDAPGAAVLFFTNHSSRNAGKGLQAFQFTVSRTRPLLSVSDHQSTLTTGQLVPQRSSIA
jgi:hypothetical protein